MNLVSFIILVAVLGWAAYWTWNSLFKNRLERRRAAQRAVEMAAAHAEKTGKPFTKEQRKKLAREIREMQIQSCNKANCTGCSLCEESAVAKNAVVPIVIDLPSEKKEERA